MYFIYYTNTYILLLHLRTLVVLMMMIMAYICIYTFPVCITETFSRYNSKIVINLERDVTSW